MGPNMEHYLSAQHCLAIAAGFIAIIAACATLISSANNKAENLSARIRDAMKERRLRSQNTDRCKQLEAQIHLFNERFKKVQRAQYLLFSTIGIYIISLVGFISMGVMIIFLKAPENQAYNIAGIPLLVIGGLVVIGTAAMLAAIVYQLLEVRKSFLTLCVETRDCPPPDAEEARLIQSAAVAESTVGKVGSVIAPSS